MIDTDPQMTYDCNACGRTGMPLLEAEDHICGQPPAPLTASARPELEIGDRVTGRVQGQDYTGTITSRAIRYGELDSVTVATDNPLTTPAGRTVYKVLVSGAEEIARLEPAESR